MIQVLLWLTLVSVTKSGLDYTCAVVVADDDANGDITYSIAYTDAAGNAGTAVTSGSGSVTIDNLHPAMASVTATDDAYGVGETLTIFCTLRFSCGSYWNSFTNTK